MYLNRSRWSACDIQINAWALARTTALAAEWENSTEIFYVSFQGLSTDSLCEQMATTTELIALFIRHANRPHDCMCCVAAVHNHFDRLLHRFFLSISHSLSLVLSYHAQTPYYLFAHVLCFCHRNQSHSAILYNPLGVVETSQFWADVNYTLIGIYRTFSTESNWIYIHIFRFNWVLIFYPSKKWSYSLKWWFIYVYWNYPFVAIQILPFVPEDQTHCLFSASFANIVIEIGWPFPTKWKKYDICRVYSIGYRGVKVQLRRNKINHTSPWNVNNVSGFLVGTLLV